MDVKTKRVYEDRDEADGHRVLVDRLWPRGLSKEEAKLDDWMKDVAPSDELREWFDHDPEKWEGFVERYREELEDKNELLGELKAYAEGGTLTLVYAAKDRERNNAVALKRILEPG